MNAQFNDDNYETIQCPVCEGRGCTICGDSGGIQRRVDSSQQQTVSPPRIIVDASDYEKDQILVQLGKVSLINPIARREYSGAIMFYRSGQNLNTIINSDEFRETFTEIKERLEADKVDQIKSVDAALGMVSNLHETFLKLFDNMKNMAERFEMALEVMNREVKEYQEKADANEQELATFRQMVMSAAVKQNRLTTEQLVKTREEDEDEEEEDMESFSGAVVEMPATYTPPAPVPLPVPKKRKKKEPVFETESEDNED